MKPRAQGCLVVASARRASYPSISSVLAQINEVDTMRLPAYRESYMRRYHPYPRPPERWYDPLMQTVDYHYEDEPVLLAPSGHDADMSNLELAVHGYCGSPVQGRRRLSTLIVDLAFAVRLRCQQIHIVKKLVPPVVDLLK